MKRALPFLTECDVASLDKGTVKHLIELALGDIIKDDAVRICMTEEMARQDWDAGFAQATVDNLEALRIVFDHQAGHPVLPGDDLVIPEDDMRDMFAMVLADLERAVNERKPVNGTHQQQMLREILVSIQVLRQIADRRLSDATRQSAVGTEDAGSKSEITLDMARESFEATPTNKAAGVYLDTLMRYETDDMIGDDTFHDGLSTVRDYLLNQTASPSASS